MAVESGTDLERSPSVRAVSGGFDDYVEARWDRLVRSAVLLGAPVHGAEDVVQTTLATCYLKWERVARADDVDAYVHRMLINTIAASRRRRWSGERATETLPDRPLDDATDRVVDSRAVVDALARLPRGQREAVVLRFYVDLTEAQAAAALGVAVGTVKSRCARALAALALDPTLRPEEGR